MHHLDDVTGAIIDSAITIHRELGPGLLESVYEVVLARELERRGFLVDRQRPVRIEYEGLSSKKASARILSSKHVWSWS